MVQQVVNAIQHVASLHKELAKAHKQATVAVLEYAAELEESGADKNALATFPSLFPELAEAPLTKKRGRVSRLSPPRRRRSSAH